MYLSRLILNPRSREVRRDLGNCQELHRTLLAAFPQAGGAGARATFGLLYRAEAHSRSGAVQVLVQSHEQPDWGALPAGYLLSTGGDVKNPDSKPVGDRYMALRDGIRLRFRLRANPTRRIAKARDAKEARWVGKRVDVRGEQEQLAWLARKGEQAGFRVVAARARDDVPNARANPRSRRSPAGAGRPGAARTGGRGR
jgi:CRISPR system Cascade subunit CasE